MDRKDWISCKRTCSQLGLDTVPGTGIVLRIIRIMNIIYKKNYIFSHIRGDGSFVINGVPSGTYVVEVMNPTYLFESVRVDITSKGKMRARRVNYLQPSVVKTVHYPLEFRDRRKANYFQKREQWKITDFLMNPMV